VSLLLQIKYRAFLSRLDSSIVGSAGDESHQDAVVRHAFYAGAEAQREVFEDNEQSSAVSKARDNASGCQFFVVGVIVGIVIAICTFFIVTAK
jgi:hypothetical protein